MSLLILGDLYYGYDEITDDIRKISEYIKSHNYQVVLNLEGPITTSQKQIRKRGEHLRQSGKTIEVLKMLNVAGVMLSNNHIMDFGEDGLRETIELLDEAEIQHSGAGRTVEEAKKPIAINDTDNIYKIYCMTDFYEESVPATKSSAGCAPIFLPRIERRKNEIDIALIHTGFEYNEYPMPRNIRQNRAMLEKGFDLVVGSHPHLVQPYERRSKRYIFYSVGNFYFSNFRGEFEARLIKRKDKGYCNFGVGVTVDKQTIDKVGIFYSKENDESWISDEVSIEELKDKIDLRYVIKCFKYRNNHNPILMGNKQMDSIKLNILNLEYSVYRKIKGIE